MWADQSRVIYIFRSAVWLMFIRDIGYGIYNSSPFPMICIYNVKIYDVCKKPKREMMKDYYFLLKMIYTSHSYSIFFNSQSLAAFLYRRYKHNDFL